MPEITMRHYSNFRPAGEGLAHDGFYHALRTSQATKSFFRTEFYDDSGDPGVRHVESFVDAQRLTTLETPTAGAHPYEVIHRKGRLPIRRYNGQITLEDSGALVYQFGVPGKIYGPIAQHDLIDGFLQTARELSDAPTVEVVDPDPELLHKSLTITTTGEEHRAELILPADSGVTLEMITERLSQE